MTSLPALFISHGSPMLAIQDSPARRFLLGLGKSLLRPEAIVVFSAHWEALGGPAVSFAERPETIHDFGGFPAALFEIDYPAPGAPQLAGKLAGLLEQAGHAVKRSPARGLDHGAWVPLRLMYPEADIPVLQVSILRGGTPAEHERLGSALSELRRDGVLVIGSGSLTHNLHEFRGQGIDAPVQAWAGEFAAWMHERLNGQMNEERRAALLDYRSRAPHAARNHPTDEHLLPMFAALGAAGTEARGERLHGSVEYGVLAMDVYAFY